VLGGIGFKVAIIKDGDYRSIDAAIKRHITMVRREGQGTISFLYYSGHGAADPDTKINYLIPVDVSNAEDKELWNYTSGAVSRWAMPAMSSAGPRQ
jgi:hypothetical protein